MVPESQQLWGLVLLVQLTKLLLGMLQTKRLEWGLQDWFVG